MTIAHVPSLTQAEIPSTRKERRQLQRTLEKKKRALERKLRRLNPDVFFDNMSTTALENQGRTSRGCPIIIVGGGSHP